MLTSVNLLIVEDEQEHIDRIVSVLREADLDASCTLAKTERDFLARLSAEPLPDIILVNYTLREFDRARVQRILREQGLDIPLIVISGTIGAEAAVECLRQGAADYIHTDQLMWLGMAVQQVLSRGMSRDERSIVEMDSSGPHHEDKQFGLSPQSYRALFEQSREAMFITTPEGGLVDCNQAMLDIVGYSRDELAQVNVSDFYVEPGERFRLQQHIEATGSIRDYEIKLKRKEGSVIVGLLTASLQRAEDGAPRVYVGSILDISERKRTQEALQEKTEELERFFSLVLDLLCIANTDGYFLKLNKEWERTLGYRLEDLEGKRFLDLVHPDDLASTLAAIAELSSGQPVLNFINRYRCQDGSYRWLEWRSAPYPNKLIYAAARDITGRKQMEETLRISEERFYKAFHTNPDAINIVRLRDGLYLDINEGFTQLTGYTQADILGKSSLEIAVWADPGDLARFVQELQDQGEVKNLEARFRCKDGSMGTGLMSAGTLEINGEPCILSITRDISERKRTEEALRASENKFRSIVTYSRDGIALTDEAGRIVEWNSALEAITALTRAEVLGQSIWDVTFRLTPEPKRSQSRHDVIKQSTRASFSGERMPENRETEIQRPDGQHRYIHTVVSPIQTDQGYLYSAVIRDLTEQKRAEQTLRTTEFRLKTVIANAPVVLWAVDASGKFTLAEGNGLAKLGMNADAVPNQSVFEVYQAYPDILRDVRRALQGETLTALHTPEGTAFETRLTPLRDQQGIIGMIGVSVDVTARIQSHQRELELAIEREKVRILADFIRDASHEFKTPLSILSLDLYLIANAAGLHPDTRRLESMRSQIDYLSQLVDALLMMTNLDCGIRGDYTIVDVNRLIHDTTLRLVEKAQAKHLKLNLRPFDARLAVQGDPDLLAQALSNLVENAVQYTPENGMITLRSERIAERVGIKVEDTGIGISETELPFIFERFYRVDKARTQRGAGLGLSIAKKIIEAHNGTIEVESTVGRGSIFRVWLPAIPKT